MSKVSTVIRSVFLGLIVVAFSMACGIRLFKIQIVDGEAILALTKSTYQASQEIEAARGKIADCHGVILNTNEIKYSVNLQRASLIAGTENEIIYRVLTVLIERGEKWNDSLPITKMAPYKFIEGKEEAADSLKSRLGLGVYATVDNCISAMYEKYEIDSKYEEQMKRYIAGVRYEMQVMNFSHYNVFVLADNISGDTMLELKELSTMLDGVDITEGWERVYLDSETAPHVRGTVGAISAQQYEKLKEDGYTMNDIIGTFGVESAMESVLRGERGTRVITRSSDGVELSDEVTEQPKAGNSVMLTLDAKFQNMVQRIVQYHMDFLHSPHYTKIHDPQLRGRNCYSGAAVVLDVKTGGVLAMASLPGYDLNKMVEDYNSVLNGDNLPMLNRAINGEYRPGSTFKTITATAGLAEGVITTGEAITCNKVYTYFAPYTPKCTGTHGAITVCDALKHSCNVFFYETSRRLGIDRLSAWAAKFGVGTDLGFELGGETGAMTSLQFYAEHNLDWNPGDVIQAGIGQAQDLLTPLHLAVQAMTVANNGVRYKPHIIKAVYNYEYTELISETKPEIVENMSGMDDIFDTVTEGMKRVSSNAGMTMDGAFQNIYSYKGLDVGQVATKTGTPEVIANTKYNSAIIGFYPADDPEIAFGVYMEDAEFSRHIAANIISAYVTGEFNPEYDEEGYATHPLGGRYTYSVDVQRD